MSLRISVWPGSLRCLPLVIALIPALSLAAEQGTVPTFQYTSGSNSYTLLGRDPAQGGTTAIPVVVVPVSLSFESSAGKPEVRDATRDVTRLLQSPVFSTFSFAAGGKAQYVDAMLRATFPKAENWHTLLSKPEVQKTVQVTIPAAYGFPLTSKRTGGAAAVVDIEYLQREIFKQVPKQEGKLVLAVTHNTTYYTEGDATLCCSWGTHGVDAATGDSFVLASYLDAAPSLIKDADVQPLTQQLAEFVYDPLHDPLIRVGTEAMPGNRFPRWLRPAGMRPGDQGRCGGDRVASAYFLLEPTDTNRKNNFPESQAYVARLNGVGYHLQNVALLPWYLGAAGGDLGNTHSFPDPQALSAAAAPCPDRRGAPGDEGEVSKATPIPRTQAPNGHQLIGYWTGDGPAGAPFPLSAISPQWDVIIVAFAAPVKNAPEGTLDFQVPNGLDAEGVKRDVESLHAQGKKVLISLGGGGQYFTLDDPKSIPTFVSCVARIVKQYGFDGVDIDFETPSLTIAAGDTDFQHPTTPSIVNLITGLRQLHTDLGSGFMISLVPEGTQIPAGHLAYGGQFGSYLPLAWGLRDVLSFMDVQDYNTPPMQGLDGEIYQAGTVDYHAAVTELVLRGFDVGRDPKKLFPALPAREVAVGFLTGETSPPVVSQAMDYLIAGKRPAGTTYVLRKAAGYAQMIGAMFWTIDDDGKEGYRFSNVVGPQLHAYPASH